jgi:hypothetical protein
MAGDKNNLASSSLVRKSIIASKVNEEWAHHIRWRRGLTQHDGADVKSVKVKHKRKPANTARYHRAENVTALNQAAFVVVRVSELSQLRGNIKSVLEILSKKAVVPFESEQS